MLNLLGKKFNRLTVLKFSHLGKGKKAYWECICDCGKYKTVASSNLVSSAVKSCGCLKTESAKRVSRLLDNRKGTEYFKNKYSYLIGKIFTHLTVIRIIGSKLNRAFCTVKCICGVEKELRVSSIISGATKSCGCKTKELISMSLRRDLTGLKFGRLSVIKVTGEKKHRNYVWECLCDCGIHAFIMSNNLVSGQSRSCGCLQKDSRRIKKGESSFNFLYSNYRRSAKDRGFRFNLSKELFKKLTSQNCFYCGVFPKQLINHKHFYGNYPYNGIDRVDNTKGYEEDNSAPCCELCNRTKADRTLHEFQDWIKRLIEFNKKGDLHV